MPSFRPLSLQAIFVIWPTDWFHVAEFLCFICMFSVMETVAGITQKFNLPKCGMTALYEGLVSVTLSPQTQWNHMFEEKKKTFFF